METLSQEIQDQATLFQKPKTDYQMKVNEAAKIISGSKTYLVRKGDRGELLDLARKKVTEGYNFKKGHSWSKVYGKGGDGTPKRPKLNRDMRQQHMDELKDDIEDTSKHISLKEKRVIHAETNRNYKLRWVEQSD